MRILGKTKIEAQNVTKKQAENSRIAAIVQEKTRTRIRYDLGDWTLALQTAERKTNPRRNLLYDIYDNIILDPHMTSVMDKIKKKINGRNLQVIDANDQEDEELTRILNKSWVQKFIDLTIEAKFFGFSLIQLGTLVNDEFSSIELVPRRHVIPENELVTVHTSTFDGHKFTDPKFSRWLVPVGERDDLGLLAKAAPWVLWKTRAMASWAVFSEVFGMPIRIGKTNATDKNAKNEMAKMLAGMGSNTWGVFDEDEMIEMIQTNRSDAFQVYNELIKRCNDEISKLFVGQTMTSEDGSSLSQAEVHKKVEDEIILSYAKFVEGILNDSLKNKMISLGVAGLKNKTIQFDLTDKLNLKQRFDMDAELLKHYKIPADYIREHYGTEVEEKQAAPAPGQNVSRETPPNETE